LGPNTGALARRARSLPNAGLDVGRGMGWLPPAVRVRGYHPRNFFWKLRC